MGFRQASGTKPSDLATPVPGDPTQDPNAVAGQVKAAPMPADQSQGQAQPSATPAPPQADASDPFATLSSAPSIPQAQPSGDASDPFSHLDPSAPSAPVDHMAKFESEGTEGSLLGFHVKVDKDGQVTTSLPGQSKYTPPNAGQVAAARAMYFTLRDAGSNVGQVAGELGGGILGTGAAPGPGTVAGAMAGGAAGGAAGAQANQWILDHIKGTETGAKMLFLLQKMGGISSDDQTPMGSAGAAILGGTAPGVGALLGAASKAVGSQLEGNAANMAANSFNGVAQPLLGDLAQASADTGISVPVATGLAGIDGNQSASSAMNDAKNGIFGNNYKTQYLAQAQQKAKELNNYVQNLVSRIAPGMDFSKPSELPIAQSTKEGFNYVNLPQASLKAHGQILGAYTDQALQKAGDQQFDSSALLNDFETFLGNKNPALGKALSSGSKDQLNDIIKNQYSADTDMKQAINQYNILKDAMSRESAFAQHSGVSATPIQSSLDSSLGMTGSASSPNVPNSMSQLGPNPSGSAVAGLPYKFIDSFTNDIQRMAQDNPLLQSLAGSARAHQGDVLQTIFKDQPGMANEIQAANQSFSEDFKGMKDLADKFAGGASNLGGAALSWDAPSVRRAMSILTPDQQAQFKGATLTAGIKDALMADPIKGMGPQAILDTFFKGPKEEAMTAMFGDKTMNELKGVVKIGQAIERANVSSQAVESGVGKAMKLVPGLSSVMGGIDKVRGVYGYIFGGNDKAMALLNDNISNYGNYMMKGSASGPTTAALGKVLQNNSGFINKTVSASGPASYINYKAYDGDSK